MNVTSTASVLPCTPADVAGFLSVVFVSPQKFDPKSLGSTFRKEFLISHLYILLIVASSRCRVVVPSCYLV